MQNIKQKINKNEILRYLGHNGQEVGESLYKLIDECIAELAEISRYRYTYKIFDVKIGMQRGMSCIELLSSSVRLEGNDIYEHLRSSKKCAVMAATLGVEVDNAIRNAERQGMLRALVLDACATEFIEKLCDAVEDEIKLKADAEGCGTSFRFSPGYGDLPIEAQSDVIAAIDATRKTGITVTENSIMIPRKSVTAIIGFTKEYRINKQKTKCDICSMRGNCMFRKGGTTCGRGRVYKA